MRGSLKIHRHAKVRRTYAHALTCSSLHLFSCVLFFFFFPLLPCNGFPRKGWRIAQPQGTERVLWLTAGSLEVEEPLKQRCRFLSHPGPSALWAPVMGSFSVANTLRTINTPLSGSWGWGSGYLQSMKCWIAINVLKNKEPTGYNHFSLLRSCQLR